MPFHHADATADHELGGGLLGDCGRERGAGERERAADGERLVMVALVPFFHRAASDLAAAVILAKCSAETGGQLIYIKSDSVPSRTLF